MMFCRLIKNYLSVDVEDYYQVSAFEPVIGPEKWDYYAPRVVANTMAILDLLERHDAKATFFVLGWTGRKNPHLIKEIAEAGHEIGCHSCYHRLIYNLSPEEFRKDTRNTKDILEQITGKRVCGYRAPSYSITLQSLWAFDILEELGFEFDSSIFPIHHDRYGIPDAPRFMYKISDSNLIEYPISTSIISGCRIPVSGGGYFRLFPYWFTRTALRRINEREKQPFVFFIHPWEIDPKQPRIKGASTISKFRHYVNLSKTAERFENLLNDFKFVPIPDQSDS